jgi:hypothetical protein
VGEGVLLYEREAHGRGSYRPVVNAAVCLRDKERK